MFAFCVEASHERGLGHLFRGLALARVLTDAGAAVTFYLNDFPPAVAQVEARSHPLRIVPLAEASGGWENDLVRRDAIRTWIDDRLDTSAAHALAVRAAGARLVTFDDRGGGAQHADLHVAGYSFDDDEALAGQRVLRGVRYLVLDPDVLRFRRERRTADRLVVTMGGSDTYGITVQVVRALARLGKAATVVLGPAFAHDAALAPHLTAGFDVKRGVASLPEELARHDLAVTAGGITAFEANAMGVPCIIVAAETWEIAAAQALERAGGAIYAGFRGAFDTDCLARTLPIERMSRAALAAVDGEGARRVAAELLAL